MADVSKVVDLATYRSRRQKPAIDQLVETIAIYDEVLARLDRLQKRAPVREARS